MVLEEYERAIHGLIDQFAAAELSPKEVNSFVGELRQLRWRDQEGYLRTAMQCYGKLIEQYGLTNNRRVTQLVPVHIMMPMANEVLMR